ncbi:DNA excision repair protein ERCC-8 [Blastomyces dermatitidis ER-3]|uniref:DNA excision repair protein ERCC-8 n=1 Tax=Ajellomyces dermatitidis (strain ER-3 / ATCC MYA-2586) TaxID=559297 RepID=A0ABP2EUT3_AJEDR|nr:DNA excision repair protein ERCC-8 [Blastomyces dermatitidis ER-3]EEQ85582.2 DNA excision repair protein ERCC-8 [Blastomyces dermatitidis ER-3]
MNSYLLNRSQGSVSSSAFHVAHNAHLIRSIEPAPGLRFSSHPAAPALNQGESEPTEDGWKGEEQDELRAHKAGVNVLTIDQYEKRFMVSGGADASVHLWDLETRGSESSHLYKSIASVTKRAHRLSRSTDPSAHTHALTSISIYPFDPTPSTILTTSHDTTLKLSSLQAPTIVPVYTFSLHSTPYSHSFSSHPSSLLLTAVGTSDKTVRLLDLRSGLATHALPGHSAAVLSVSWAPHHEYLLASASNDNRVILFDVRRGGHNSALASLDMDDAVGVIAPHDAPSSFSCRNPFVPGARAHNGAVTGVRWTSNGSHIITSGHDARIRVWDASTGANSLVHFGPRIRNSSSLHLAERAPLVLPSDITGAVLDTLLWPNYGDQDDRGEIFMFALRDGTFIKRLNVPGVPSSRQKMRGKPTALSAARINGLAWRGSGGSGEGMELFSAHGDGTIRAWVSRTADEEHEIAEEEEEMEDKKRKRDVLDEVYRGLMNRNVTFT